MFKNMSLKSSKLYIAFTCFTVYRLCCTIVTDIHSFLLFPFNNTYTFSRHYILYSKILHRCFRFFFILLLSHAIIYRTMRTLYTLFEMSCSCSGKVVWNSWKEYLRKYTYCYNANSEYKVPSCNLYTFKDCVW